MLSDTTGLKAACTFASELVEVSGLEIPNRVVFNQLNTLNGACNAPPSW